MIEIAQTYLGNLIDNASLSEQIEAARKTKRCLEVYLSQIDSGKGRIHAKSTSGVAVGIIKSRDWSLQEGDVLATEQGKLLLIHLQAQKLMVLSFTAPVPNHAVKLVHLGHVLGNHHWSIIVQDNKIYVQIAVDVEVMETTIREFQIPGLKIDYELRSPNAQLNFSPHTHDHNHS